MNYTQGAASAWTNIKGKAVVITRRTSGASPSPIDTPILQRAFVDFAAPMRDQMAGMVPMKRFSMPDEIAKAVLFLAFDAAFATGDERPVDGGWTQL